MAALSNTAQRVVVADDSRLMRRILSDALGRQGFDVVATAADGDEALAACNQFRPDALTLDLHMPGLDGLGVLRALRAGKAEPVPVVVVSAFSPAHGARAVDALRRGAFDLVAKPAMGESMADFTAELSKKVSDAAISGKARARRPRVAPSAAPRAARPRRPRRPLRDQEVRRDRVLDRRPEGPRRADPEAPGAARHRVADRPAHAAGLHGVAGDAPGRHVQAQRRARPRATRRWTRVTCISRRVARICGWATTARVRLSDEAPMGGLRPRADLTIADAAKLYGTALVLVVLTGMGKDGLDGARAVKKAGGRVLVEAESTCVVYGMPRAVAEAGLADEILPLHELPAAIAREAGA